MRSGSTAVSRIKDRPTFEVIVERINAYVDEKQAHSYLMQAMVYELLLDQPLLAAHSYVCLAQLSESTQALACMQKALLFFKKTGLALNYAHFLEKIDRKFLVRFVENPLISLELYVRSEMKQLG